MALAQFGCVFPLAAPSFCFMILDFKVGDDIHLAISGAATCISWSLLLFSLTLYIMFKTWHVGFFSLDPTSDLFGRLRSSAPKDRLSMGR